MAKKKTAQKSPRKVAAKTYPHTDLDGAFQNGVMFDGGDYEHRIETADWGKLVVPSGKIVACDVMMPKWGKPFRQTVPPGTYPVTISWNQSAVCAMQVRFKRGKAVAWEPALRVGDKKPTGPLPPCFGVDSGVAAFFDAAAAKKVDKEFEDWGEQFSAVYGKQHVLELNPKNGANVVWSHSGHGDGGYPSFWGRDRQGEIVCLAIDFLVLVKPRYEIFEINDLAAKLKEGIVEPRLADAGYSEVRLTWRRAKGELELRYCGPDWLEFSLVSGKGKQGHAGSSGGGSQGTYYHLRKFDPRSDPKAKIILQRFVGFESLPRK